MKTAKEWMGEWDTLGHKLYCVCERCKNGSERFMLESDIRDVQKDATTDIESKLAEAQAEKVYANGKLSEAMVKLNELREMLKGR